MQNTNYSIRDTMHVTNEYWHLNELQLAFFIKKQKIISLTSSC